MSDTTDWLEQNGLGMYVEAFASNDVTFDVFSELDDADLRELGLSLGHRKRFLKAVRALSVSTAESSAELPASADTPPPVGSAPGSTPGSVAHTAATHATADTHQTPPTYAGVELPTGSDRSGSAAANTPYSDPLGHQAAANDAVTGGLGSGKLPGVSDHASSAERRQLTVMFCDLVGSTALVNQLGAEDTQELFRQYQALCAKAVGRYSGYVSRYLGDGVVVYFGYPRAHELDADRAIRAGRMLIDLIGDLDRQYQLSHQCRIQVRVGIATGQVVVGDIIGEGASLERAVVGETPNLAARIQALGEPNTVTVSDLTQRLTGAAFDFDDLGHHELKGFSAPVPAWKVVAERSIESRFNAVFNQQDSSFIGRADELQLLLNHWQLAQHGEGEVFVLSGEAGIGKSRLLEAFLQHDDCASATQLRMQCSPYHTGSVLQPVLEFLQRALHHAVTKNSVTQRAFWEEFFSEHTPHVQEASHYYSSMLGAGYEIMPAPDDLLPAVIQQRASTALIDRLEHSSQQNPHLVIIEDVHWLDATTHELLLQLAQRLHRFACMVIVTSRPGISLSWPGARCNTTKLDLPKLSRAQVQSIVERLAHPQRLSREVLDVIVEKTDGVPLFVEELTKSVLGNRRGSTAAGNARPQPIHDLANLDIPETLHELLMSRLDRDPEVRGLVQIGAAIGRDFAHRILASLAPYEDIELRRHLQAVIEAELVFRSGSESSTVYTFRHALLQDAAYQSLLKKHRRVLHKRIAIILEQIPTETSPEILAEHWSKAGDPARALPHWREAARNAKRLSANTEAISRYRKAIDAADKDLESDNQKIKTELLLELGEILRGTRGSSSPETIEAFISATVICESLSDNVLRLRAWYGLFTAHFTSANLPKAKDAANQLDDLAKHSPDSSSVAKAIAAQANGMVSFVCSDFAKAREKLEEALSYQDSFESEFDLQYPALSKSYLSWVLFLSGEKSTALNMGHHAIAEARQHSAYSYALAMANTCYLHQFDKDIVALKKLTGELRDISLDKGFTAWEAVADFFECWCLCQLEPAAGDLDRLLAVMEYWGDDEIEIPYFQTIVAETLLDNGRNKEALELANRATRLIRRTGETWYAAPLQVLLDRANKKGQIRSIT